MFKHAFVLLLTVTTLAGCGIQPGPGITTSTGSALVAQGSKLKEAEYASAGFSELLQLVETRGNGKVQVKGYFHFGRSASGMFVDKRGWVNFSDQQDKEQLGRGNYVTVADKAFNGLFKGGGFPDNAINWFTDMQLKDKNGGAVTAFFTLREGRLETDAVKYSDGSVKMHPMK